MHKARVTRTELERTASMMPTEEADYLARWRAELFMRGMELFPEKVGGVGVLEKPLPVRARMMPVVTVKTT